MKAARPLQEAMNGAEEAINAGKFVISKKQAKKVKTPVLLFQAGKETLVTPW